MHFRNNVRLLLPILVAFFLIAGIIGCKEGTNKTTVGQLVGADGGTLSGLEKEGVIFYPVTGKLSTSATEKGLGNTLINIIQNGKVVGNTSSADDGSFFIRLPEGFYEFSAAPQHEFFASSSFFIRVQPEGTVSPEVIEIAINDQNEASQKRFSVTGKCVNANNPQESAGHILVELGLGQSPFKATQVTQASTLGEYSFKDILPGHYILRLAYNSPVYNEELHKFEIDSSGKFSPPVNVLMVTPRDGEEETFPIVGKIVSQKNLMEPVSNALIELLDDNGTPIRVQQSTNSGDYHFEQIAPGDYQLRVTDTSGKFVAATTIMALSKDGIIKPPVNLIRLEPQAASGVALFNISGRAMNRNNTTEPAPYIAVELTKNVAGLSETVQIQQTNPSGVFSFSNIPAGEYQISFAKDADFFEYRPPTTLRITDTGLISPPVDMVLIWPKEEVTRFHTVKGTAVSSNNIENTINFAMTQLLDLSGNLIHVQTTSSKGVFSFPQVLAGTYDLSITPTSDNYLPYSKQIKINDDGTVSPPINYVFIDPSVLDNSMLYKSVSGSVKDIFTGAPIEYVNLSIPNVGNTLSDRNGNFKFNSVPTGHHQMTIVKDGFDELKHYFEIVANEDKTDLLIIPADLNIKLVYSVEKDKGSIAGRIADDNDGTPLVDKIVRVYRKSYITQIKVVLVGSAFKEVKRSGWKIAKDPYKTTRTSENINSMDLEGTFKLTHLPASTETEKYIVFIGNNNSQLETKEVDDETYPEFKWDTYKKPDERSDYAPPSPSNQVMVWDNIEVSANTTTYLANFEMHK